MESVMTVLWNVGVSEKMMTLQQQEYPNNHVLCWWLGRAIKGRHRPHHVFTGFTRPSVQI